MGSFHNPFHHHFAHIATYFWHQCVANSLSQYDVDAWERLAKLYDQFSGYYDYESEDERTN